MSRPRVYLAGPDVFLPNAIAFAEAKRKLCDAYRFTGASPFDNAVDLATLSKREAALRISAANETMIRGCDLVIANITPFRGPSADVGTAYEMGFASALGLPVFAYTNVAGSLVERTRQALGLSAGEAPSGHFHDAFGMAIEDFDGVDNLMLDGAVEANGVTIVVKAVRDDALRFTDLSAFEDCLKLAARVFETARDPNGNFNRPRRA